MCHCGFNVYIGSIKLVLASLKCRKRDSIGVGILVVNWSARYSEAHLFDVLLKVVLLPLQFVFISVHLSKILEQKAALYLTAQKVEFRWHLWINKGLQLIHVGILQRITRCWDHVRGFIVAIHPPECSQEAANSCSFTGLIRITHVQHCPYLTNK